LLQFGAGHSMRGSEPLMMSQSMLDVRESDRLDLEFAREPPPSELEPAGAAAAVASTPRGLFGGSVPPDSDRTGLADPPEDWPIAFLPVAQRLLRSLRSLPPFMSERDAATHVRPRLPRPFGVLPSMSLVGESEANLQNTFRVEQRLTIHQTHYRSCWGRVLMGQMTQPTVSKQEIPK